MSLLMTHAMECDGKSKVKEEHTDLGALLQTMAGCRTERLGMLRCLSTKKPVQRGKKW